MPFLGHWKKLWALGALLASHGALFLEVEYIGPGEFEFDMKPCASLKFLLSEH